MKKSFLAMTALAAMLFAGCTSSDELTTLESIKNDSPTPVQFGTYVGKVGTTRAGTAGDIASLGDLASKGGFGVFAYYTNAGSYSDASSTANFMFNEAVTSASTPYNVWTYSPVKYWPNETANGNVDQQGTPATSTGGPDKLTFFAYAPYVASASGTSGIVAFVENDDETAYTNTSIGDPRIKYVVDSDPTKCVDLLWGVVSTADASADHEVINNATLTAGKPWLDITKQEVDGKITFQFKHALAKLHITVDSDIDESNHGHATDVDGNTKIYVRSATITGTYNQTGYLNLNNSTANTPLWENLNGTAITPTSNTNTFKDGRTDGTEGYADGSGGLSNTETATLNSTIIQGATSSDLTGTGVTYTAAPLLTNNGDFYVIPTSTTANTFTVNIVYDVLTKDSKLAGTLADGTTPGSLIKNNITKTASFSILPGKVYNIALHLGLTSVKMDALVETWDPVNEDIDLPKNVD
jgi:hypothetical protein